jgi:CheY-like chemotaxis protein
MMNYDLAITDLSMPELDGRSAIARIRGDEEVNQLEHLPIIVLSADGQASTRDDILAAGADGHAEKPVDPEWLVSLVAMTARKRTGAGRLDTRMLGNPGELTHVPHILREMVTDGMANVTRMSQNHG